MSLIHLAERPIIDSDATDNTQLAAIATLHTIQVFFTNLGYLWTEFYGRHCKCFTSENLLDQKDDFREDW
jgi:hypothetical protein